MKGNSLAILALLAAEAFSSFAQAADEKELTQILFKNVNIFNGTENRLYKNHHVLVTGNKIAKMTSTAGEVLALSGPRNPAKGKLGVIEAGALADMILVDGNPLEDFTTIGGTDAWFDADPEYEEIETLKVIMKDGVIYKNSL